MKKHLFFILFITIVLGCFNAGVFGAPFTSPKDITKYIPAGFTIDEARSATRDLGMFVSTNVIGTKKNDLPKPFESPATADFSLGFVRFSDRSLASKAWEEAKQNAEKNSTNDQSYPNRKFIGKEDLPGGGAIYWYKETAVYAQWTDGKGRQLDIYKIELVKQINNTGILIIIVSDFVGEQDTIRKWFQ